MKGSSRGVADRVRVCFGMFGFALVGVFGAGCAAGQSSSEEEPSAASSVEGVLADTTLARLMDQILPEVVRSSGLEPAGRLNVAATDEGRLRAYLERQLGTELPEEEAARITAVYARFGLVPPDLDLRGLLRELLQEQVVGYYDPDSDTLFVHSRVPASELEPVLAHELVHALQDQYVPLDSLGDSFGDRSDPAAAYQAAVEGHATFAMMEWQAGAIGGGGADLTQFPDLAPMLENIDLTEFGDFGSADVLAAAPAVIREGLIFPYISGLIFLQRAWRELPARPVPLREGMPESTEQILHVERWIERDHPTQVLFARSADEADGWDEVRASDLGEFEIRLFLREHLAGGAPDEVADEAAAGWDGDAYRLLRSDDDEALVWVSVWDSPADAREFAAAARAAYASRYRGVDRTPAVTVSEGVRPLVTVIDAPPGVTVPEAMTRVELSGN